VEAVASGTRAVDARGTVNASITKWPGAGHACVLARPLFAVAQKTALVIGVGACRGPLDARCGAKSIGLFAMQRKSDRKFAF
jgi:hypothetical protein